MTEEEIAEQQRKDEERRNYLADKHCAYCTHLIPDKRDGRQFYCDKIYSYVSGSQGACNEYEEAGRSTLESDLIYSDQYGYQAEEHDCAFCTHLIPDKKSEGRYYCDKLSTYVRGTDSNKTMRCDHFAEAGRSTLESEMIRDDSEVLDAHTESDLRKRYCCDCKYYNVDDKKGPGYYTCIKRNQTMAANQDECYMFEESGRSSVENEKLYDEAKEAQKDTEVKGSGGPGNTFIYIILGFGLAIAAVLYNLFGR